MIPSRTDYLHTEVMTATPQKLQLMLIEAALRVRRRKPGSTGPQDEKPPPAWR